MMNNTQGMATYSPEDNKLRLYIGRVPREEYLKLRAEGWVTLHKQREAGGGDFAAVWTPQRRDTALAYAGIIEDEDMGPAERAADRAERFGEYRDKRTAEATGHADRYDSQPAAHGYQNADRAERSAARHDRIADHATDAWSKAEYWQRRTAGVIAHALYVSSPDVRMGRIKTLEADLRRVAGSGGAWETHYKMRLLYENQMLEAQGGRAAFVEMVKGGLLGKRLIVKVNKSTATGRVVSVFVKGPYADGWAYRKQNVIGTKEFSLYQIETERLPENAYTPPTPESMAELAAYEKTRKAASEAVKAKLPPCPLINPTDADAARLQASFNAKHSRDDEEPPTVERITQAVYSANSGGSFSACETVELCGGGRKKSTHYMSRTQQDFPSVCKVRVHGRRVLIITDKPQKPFPASLWVDPMPALKEKVLARFDELQKALGAAWLDDIHKDGLELIEDARRAGLAYVSSQTQYGLTDEGNEIARQRREVVCA